MSGTTALLEVEALGATEAWCIEQAVSIISKAIAQIDSLREDVRVSEIPLLRTS